MDATPLYDLSPVFRLMLLGIIVAAGPLAWIWLRYFSVLGCKEGCALPDQRRK